MVFPQTKEPSFGSVDNPSISSDIVADMADERPFRNYGDRSVGSDHRGKRRRTADGIRRLVIDELRRRKWSEFIVARLIGAATAMLSRSQLGNLIGVGVPAVGQHLQFFDLPHLFGRNRHRMEKMTVVRVVINVVMDNPALNVNGALQIV